MRRVLFLMITVFVAVCFCGVSFSVAGDMEVADNAVDLGVANSAVAAIPDRNYIRDVWVSDSSASTSAAVRVFSSGSTVVAHVNYYIATAGETTRYYIVANAAGSVAFLTAAVGAETTGQKTKFVNVTGLADGVYFFTFASLMTDNRMISPTPYWFVIE